MKKIHRLILSVVAAATLGCATYTPVSQQILKGVSGQFECRPWMPGMSRWETDSGGLRFDFDNKIAVGSGSRKQDMPNSQNGYLHEVTFTVNGIGIADHRIPEVKNFNSKEVVLKGTFTVHWKSYVPGVTVSTSRLFHDWGALGLDGNATEFTVTTHQATVSYANTQVPPYLWVKVMPDGPELPPGHKAHLSGLGSFQLFQVGR